MRIYNENVFTTLIKLIGGGKFRKALRDAEKVSEEDPGIEARIKQYAKDSAELKDEMETFCKNYPDSFLCRGRGKRGVSDFESAE